ncbi:MAG: dihydrolipoamide dehydrogenase [Alphaproteobacteria bacterium]|nr:dihydrolipoamide dehydrogenase [Alphaproteobacteria bacterium]
MAEVLTPDLCVIGAGSGGLSIAAGASQMGASVVLVERAKMGGDCLNYGCVPSKALIAAGHAAHAIRNAHRFGVSAGAPAIDFAAVHRHVHGVIAAIAPNDSVERFTGLGVRVIQAEARFTGPDEAEAGEWRIRARRFVVATGSSAFVPPIPGLDRVPYLTNESVFDLTQCPGHLIVVGGGPIGCELAQAHRRLGARVSVVELATLMPKDDPELVAIVRARLKAEGVEIHEGVKVLGVAPRGTGVAVTAEANGIAREIEGTHLLLAVGRRANVKGLGLEAAGVAFGPGGLKVDARLRSTNPRVYAAGDAAGGLQFTHMAGHHAGIVIRNVLFRMGARVETRAVPWVTYTDPELAHVGLTEAGAKAAQQDIRILRWPFHENDRAQAERETEGLIKVIVSPKGRVLGASIAGPRAGDLIMPWVLAVQEGLKIHAMAKAIAPYPTLSEVGKRVAGTFFTPTLFSARTKRVVRFLKRLG